MDYLKNMTVKELKSLASDMGIKGRSSMDKVALVGAIGTVVNIDHDEAIEIANAMVQVDQVMMTTAQAMRNVYKGIGNGQRTQNYVRQNGTYKLTPAQNRRFNKKGNKEFGYYVRSLQDA